MAAIEGQNGLVCTPTQVWHIDSGYTIEFYRGADYMRSLQALRWRVAQMNGDVFRLNPFQTVEEITFHMINENGKKMTDRGRSIFIASLGDDPDAREDVGFCIQRLVQVPLADGSIENVVWTPLRAVDRDHQRNGIGTAFIEKGDDAYTWFAPAYFMGRTQNPAVILTLRRSKLFDVIYPIDKEFDDGPQLLLEQVAPKTVHATEKVHPKTGLAIELYPEGRTGGYDPDLENPEFAEISRRMADLGLVRERGDSLYYAARVRARFEAKYRYLPILGIE